MKIGIIVAIKDEANILAKALNLSMKVDTNSTCFIYTSESIVMVVPGEDKNFLTYNVSPVGRPGKVSAGIATTLLIERYNPDVIINCGTAAGIASKGIEIGDIIVADYVANHDIHIPLPGYDRYGERKIAMSKLDIFKNIQFPYKIGTVSSAESFTSSDKEWKVMKKNDVIAKEMEAAGVIQATQILGFTKSIYVIKALTDKEEPTTSDDNQASDFSLNFEIAMNNLASFITEFVKILLKV